MKNKEILSEEKKHLYELGILKSVDEELLTKNVWRKRGYKVKKEEKPITSCRVWIPTQDKLDPNGKVIRRGKMYFVLAYFYTIEQVEI